MPGSPRDLDAILAPIDGSDCSFRALEFATGMAAQYDATLDVVHVTDEESAATDDLRTRARTLLDAAAIPTDLEVVEELDLEFRPAEQVGKTVLHLVTDRGYDHVVMGHHGSGTFERALIGSAAETVVEADRVPVTIVP
ncbi:universal stress protein [Halanaeroarchaeum sulfurireducens]|uniref:UspA domain-containing protein n=1 Tax=Halanaeroarchaeum sulfurireducens TaxID=1604004 RepID=A0A0F7P783_9EURY|nr:universal stress protein [Halanaeroarchaeum sulfurireducens]AKH96557.1 UspA domain-containing protein [Halanaeroarchaeum sulfurireducens]ALG80959.1 UspA domain-containing protein [Halanaeroarchaeum sulfurireducens]